MLKLVRLSRARGEAMVVFGFTAENEARISRRPIMFQPGKDLARMRIQGDDGEWYEIADLVFVSGETEEALRAHLESEGVDPKALEAAHEQRGTVMKSKPGAPVRKH